MSALALLAFVIRRSHGCATNQWVSKECVHIEQSGDTEAHVMHEWVDHVLFPSFICQLKFWLHRSCTLSMDVSDFAIFYKSCRLFSFFHSRDSSPF